MRFSYCITALVLFPLCAFSKQSERLIFSQPPVEKNTLVTIHSNEEESLSLFKHSTRTIEFPTQIIRTTGMLEGQELNCDQVNDIVQE